MRTDIARASCGQDSGPLCHLVARGRRRMRRSPGRHRAIPRNHRLLSRSQDAQRSCCRWRDDSVIHLSPFLQDFRQCPEPAPRAFICRDSISSTISLAALLRSPAARRAPPMGFSPNRMARELAGDLQPQYPAVHFSNGSRGGRRPLDLRHADLRPPRGGIEPRPLHVDSRPAAISPRTRNQRCCRAFLGNRGAGPLRMFGGFPCPPQQVPFPAASGINRTGDPLIRFIRFNFFSLGDPPAFL
jgi:hypothetical protein